MHNFFKVQMKVFAPQRVETDEEIKKKIKSFMTDSIFL